MEGVEDGDGVGELVVDGVLVAVERVQGGDLDPAGTPRREHSASLRRPIRIVRERGRAAVPDESVLSHGSDRHAGQEKAETHV